MPGSSNWEQEGRTDTEQATAREERILLKRLRIIINGIKGLNLIFSLSLEMKLSQPGIFYVQNQHIPEQTGKCGTTFYFGKPIFVENAEGCQNKMSWKEKRHLPVGSGICNFAK